MDDFKTRVASLTLYLPNVKSIDLRELRTYLRNRNATILGVTCAGGVSLLIIGSLATYLRRRSRPRRRTKNNGYIYPLKGPESFAHRQIEITSFSDLTAIIGPASSATNLSDYQGNLNRECRLYSAGESFPKLDGNRTFMAIHLTEDMYRELYERKTYTGLTIDDVIQIGLDTPRHNFCGVTAGDEDVYDLFSPLVDHVISDRHQGFRRGDNLQIHSMNPLEIQGPDLHKDFVNNIHFVVARSLKGYRFAPSCSRAERREIQEKLRRVLETLTGEFKGTFVPIGGISQATYNAMGDVFKNMADEPTADWLIRGGYARDWPDGRGIFYNNDNSLVISINKEDHLRIFYKNNSSDFFNSFEKFALLMDELDFGMRGQGIEFAVHKDLGFLTSCPSTIGTGLRLGVNLKLPKLSKYPRSTVKAILSSLSLKSVGRSYDLSEATCLDVYNQQRLGITEVSIANTVKEGARFLIALERRLQRGLDVEDLLNAVGIARPSQS